MLQSLQTRRVHDHLTRDIIDPETERRVLTRDQAINVADQLLNISGERNIVTGIDHTFQSIVKVARNRVVGSFSVDTGRIGFSTAIGSGIFTQAGTNVLDPVLLRQTALQILAEAPPASASDRGGGSDEYRNEYLARSYLPVQLWHSDTVSAIGEQAIQVADAMVQVAKREGLVAAGTITLTMKTQLIKSPLGLCAFGEETDAEVTMTARSPDGTASGWCGDAHRNWSRLDMERLITGAINTSQQSRDAVGLEPGRRIAILSPFAVAQLLYPLMRLFDSLSTNRGGTPFSLNTDRRNRVGMKVFDERVQMQVDPQDPEGGYPPFVQQGMTDWHPQGIPVGQTTFVERGVLRSLMYGARDAAREGHRPMGGFEPVRMQAAPGVETSSLEEMIAQCDDGVYVNRFSDVALVDGATGLMTGVTRDGCFHVRKGKIFKPIKNFRFIDSPMFALNSVLQIGPARRVPMGFMQGGSEREGRPLRVPLFPIICPPLMVQDFNFSALSDAV